jgi:hypothetical protein
LQAGEPANAQPQHRVHDVLLHLQATLASTLEQPAEEAVIAAAPDKLAQQPQQLEQHMSGSLPSLPLPLAAAQLQVLALSRQMQLLHQQQTSLLQLLQQQGQLEAEQLASGSIISNSSSACSVCFDWRVELPYQSSDMPIDCVHLVLMVGGSSSSSSSSSSRQQPAAAVKVAGQCAEATAEVGGSAAELDVEHVAAQPAAAVAWSIAGDVPLLVMPAAAQQEVQQLLLPAMRQEVQAAQHQEQDQAQAHQQQELEHQQQQQQQQLATPQEPVASHIVEHAAWLYYCQLSRDIATVLQLSLAADEAAAAAGNTASTTNTSVMVAVGGIGSFAVEAAMAAAAAAAAAAATGQQPVTVGSALLVIVHDEPLPTAAAAADAAAAAPNPAAVLQQLAEVLLFPLLLPFLATQGLHNMLRLLLLCLPPQLRLQWQQQQPAHTWWTAPSSACGLPEVEKPSVTAAAAAAAAGGGGGGGEQGAGVSSSSSSGETSGEVKAASSAAGKPQLAMAAPAEGAAAGTRSPAVLGAAQATEAAAAAAARVPRYLPLTQFRDRSTEQR